MTYWINGALFTLGGTDPWVIATAAPEPGSLALLASGLIGVVALRRRRRAG